MNYVDSLNLFGVEAKEIPSIKGAGAPTGKTEGVVGCLYMDTDTGALYKCTSTSDGSFTWSPVNTTDTEIIYWYPDNGACDFDYEVLKTAFNQGKIVMIESFFSDSTGKSTRHFCVEVVYVRNFMTFVHPGSDYVDVICVYPDGTSKQNRVSIGDAGGVYNVNLIDNGTNIDKPLDEVKNAFLSGKVVTLTHAMDGAVRRYLCFDYGCFEPLPSMGMGMAQFLVFGSTGTDRTSLVRVIDWDGLSVETIDFPFGGGVGQQTGQGGEIFGDYETNQATAEFATAFGSESKAAAKGAIAAGMRIPKSGANVTYDEDGRQVPENEEDWRYNEAYGYGSEAFGKGAVAYSRASKSLGYRTQTGYPPSAEIAALRSDDAIKYDKLLFDITKPVSKGSGVVVTDTTITMPGATAITYDCSGGVVCFKASVDFNLSSPNVAHIAISIEDEIKTFDFNTPGIQNIQFSVPHRGSFSITHYNDQESESSASIYDIVCYPADNVGQAAVAIGSDTAALNNHDFAGGWGSVAKGWHSFSFGGHCESSKEYAVSFGNYSKATGYAAMAIGDHCESSAENTFAGGFESKASSGNSIAFGYGCKASTRRTVALGSEANASGEMGATAIGHQVTAHGKGATAMGSGTNAKGEGSFAVGAGSQATSYGAFAYGDHCVASNYNAIAGGANSKAEQANTGAIGRRVITGRSAQFVVGQDNVKDTNALFVVGNGTSDTNRKNAFVVNADGSAKVSGQLSFYSIDNASRERIFSHKASYDAPTNDDKGDYIGQIWIRKDPEDGAITAEVYMYVGTNLGGYYWLNLTSNGGV